MSDSPTNQAILSSSALVSHLTYTKLSSGALKIDQLELSQSSPLSSEPEEYEI